MTSYRVSRLLWTVVRKIKNRLKSKIFLVMRMPDSYNHKFSCFFQPAGCSAAWLARVPWEHEVASSNLATPTIHNRMQHNRRLLHPIVLQLLCLPDFIRYTFLPGV